MLEVISPIKPHTLKKIEIITKYVDSWARKILEFEGSLGLVYIDCMSNCGVYYDENNAEVEGTAIRVAKLLNQIAQNYPNKKVILYFNDLSPEKIDLLQERIKLLEFKDVQIHYSKIDCNTFLKAFNLIEYKSYNTLMVYDPYEASIDWEAVSPFLKIWGEVIINHMTSDTKRGAALARKKEVIKKYEQTYMTDISNIITLGNNPEVLNKVVIDIIKTQTPSSTVFVSSFSFFNKNNGQLYHLIHCSKNIEGLKLFKKVVWNIFGDKSSLKNTHGKETQLSLFSQSGNIVCAETDEDCYTMQDVAKYVYEKYSSLPSVDLETVYADLDRHPVFPSDGYKLKLKSELKLLYSVEIKKGNIYFKNRG